MARVGIKKTRRGLVMYQRRAVLMSGTSSFD